MINEKENKQTLFNIESIDQLGPERKADYVKLMIKDCIIKHPGGISGQLLSELTGIAQKTVKKYLDQMSATREILKKEYGIRMTIYFPIGRESSNINILTVKSKETTIRLQLIENTFGEFVYLQETKKDSQTMMTKTVGGVMIDCESIPDIIDALKELSSYNENSEIYSK